MLLLRKVLLWSLVLFALPVFGQPVPDSLFNGMKWRLIGPFRGGRSVAVASVPGDPTQYYFGAAAGGVWKSGDGGANWTPLTDKESIASIGALAVAESDPNVLYAGSGEASIRGNVANGDGIYKSSDGGRTWRNMGLRDCQHIGAVIIHPRDPNIAFVAALGHAYGPNPERGIFRTLDGGRTWEKVLYKNDRSGGIAVVFDPHSPSILYAALWEVVRTPWSLTSGGEGSGLYKSVDGGSTWTRLEGNGLPKGIKGKIGVSVSGADGSRVYASIEAEEGGIFRSDDSGQNWTRVNDDERFRQRAWYFSHIFADPKSADTVYVQNTGLFRSTDAGKTFELLPARHGDHHGLWIDPTAPDRMIESSDGGASISFDHGKTWTTQANQPTAQFYHVAVDNLFPYHLYGAQQDNSSIAIASMDDAGAIVQRDWYDVAGGECGFVIPDPRDADITYGSSENLIGRLDRHNMQEQIIPVWPVDVSGHAAKDLEHRFNWTSPLIMSPFDPDTLYYGMERLYKTSDRGASWTAISPDLTRNDKSRQQASGGPITKDITSVEYYDTIFAIAESPLRAGLVWVGTDDGLIQLTRDDGGSWANVTPSGMPPWSTINMIEPSRYQADTAYVAVDRHKLDDIRPYVFVTRDGGHSWERLDTDLPDGSFVHAVREDSLKHDLLYAATETGVFVSFDAGQHWQSLQLNLPRSPVHDLAVSGSDLGVATHGRSFWILDDVTPLRQVTAAAAASGAWLYAPQTGYRLYYPDAVDKRPPSGQNPPAGVLIDYYLPTEPTGPVTLEIVDAGGSVVRHLSSAKAKGPEQPPEWPDLIQPTDTLPAVKGMNRFVWDLRYDDPAQIPGAFYAGVPPRGPVVLPGAYTLRLGYAGQTRTAPLVIAADPRDRGPALAGLRQKFDLAMEVYRDQDALHRAVNEIRAVRTGVTALSARATGKPRGTALGAASAALSAAASKIESVLMQVDIKGSEANLNYPGMLNEQIYSFSQLLDDADTAPNQQESETYAGLHARLTAQLADWSALKSTQVTAFCKQVREAGVGDAAASCP